MSYFSVKSGCRLKVGQIFNSRTAEIPFWSFYVNCYEKNTLGLTKFGSIKIVCYDRRMVSPGDYVRIDSINELRIGRAYNSRGGINTYYSLVCSLEKL